MGSISAQRPSIDHGKQVGEAAGTLRVDDQESHVGHGSDGRAGRDLGGPGGEADGLVAAQPGDGNTAEQYLGDTPLDHEGLRRVAALAHEGPAGPDLQ